MNLELGKSLKLKLQREVLFLEIKKFAFLWIILPSQSHKQKKNCIRPQKYNQIICTRVCWIGCVIC